MDYGTKLIIIGHRLLDSSAV